jgi:hypothetical protein
MRHLGSLGILALVMTSGLACAHQGFRDGEFVGRDGYRIGYTEAATYSVVPSEWRLENYYLTKQGQPSGEKDDRAYEDTVDWEDDTGRTFRVTYQLLDLKWRHKNGSVLSVCVIPMSARQRNLNLDAFVEQWANDYNGLQFSLKRAEARRIASKVLESKARQIDGHAAHEVTFDVVDMDQLQLDPKAPRSRIRAVFVKDLHRNLGPRLNRVPAYLLVAYESSDGHFDAVVPDYEGLLSRIRFDKQ